MAFNLHNHVHNFIFREVIEMKRSFVDILHAAMTNQFVILAVGIALFLMAIMSDPGQTEAVISQLWG
jgi:hypothetical protein